MADAGPFANPEHLPPYPNPQRTDRVIGGLSVVEAEVRNIYEGGSTRAHLRIIGAQQTNVAGRPLVYADTYSRYPADETYSYARHDLNRTVLLQHLEKYLSNVLRVGFSELRDRSAVGVMQTENELWEFEYPTYLEAVAAMRAQPLIFARLNFPFGDITIEFQDWADVTENEFRALNLGGLQRELERPLFAFDATRSTRLDIWEPFLASIHWARGLVPQDVLRQVLRMASRVTATA